MSDYIEHLKKRNQLRAEAARKALDALWRTMDQHSILSFSFEYSGSGDCGDIDRMLMNYKDSAGEATSYVKEDCGGFIPTVADWFRLIPREPWMNHGYKLTRSELGDTDEA